MSTFPGAIYSPRVLQNKTGKPYNPTQLKILYAEDINLTSAEVVAIQNALGLNPKGSAASVAARFTTDESAIAGKQAALGYTPEDAANKDTSGTMGSNSDTKYPSQKAVKTYVDANHAALSSDIAAAILHRDEIYYLTADQSVQGNNGTNQVNDFVKSISPNKLVAFEMCLVVDSNVAAGFHYQVIGNGAVSGGFKESQDAATLAARTGNINISVTWGGTQVQIIRLTGMLNYGASGAYLGLAIGQQTSNAYATKLKAGSWLRYKILN